ncbi:MAG: hypothetical protein MZU97_06815 [Bacillus subtilis]|nr:hypothetical protein [Bacillus subtilis]
MFVSEKRGPEERHREQGRDRAGKLPARSPANRYVLDQSNLKELGEIDE